MIKGSSIGSAARTVDCELCGQSWGERVREDKEILYFQSSILILIPDFILSLPSLERSDAVAKSKSSLLGFI